MVRFKLIQKGFKTLPAVFYRTQRGSEPVREWLQSLIKADRRAIGADIKAAEYGVPLGMPTSRALGSGLFEIRTSLEMHRVARTLFCVADG